jgi:hypothetical protein
MDVERQREELNRVPGLGLADGVLFCRWVRAGEGRRSAGYSDKLKAQQMMFGVLKQDPVKEVSITERHTVVGALEILQRFVVPFSSGVDISG